MIAITGATGHTGKRAAESLLQNGEKIRAIGRDAKKLEPLAQKGAEAFVGDLAEAGSMTKAFSGAAAVYLMIPPAMERDPFRAYQEQIGDSYAAAVERAKISHVVALSSVVAPSRMVALEVLARTIKVPRLSRQIDSKLKDPFCMENH